MISVSTFLAVRALHEEGVPKKAIARRLSIDVRTVRKHIIRIRRGAKGPERDPGPSKLDPFVGEIEVKVMQGLSATQIYQDLCGRPDFSVSYETVKRRVRALRPVEASVYCRMRFDPGEEAQIDFGDLGMMNVEGVQRRVYLFVMTLCFSRYSYCELVLDQTVPTFLGSIRRGFEWLGGVPSRLKPDNLRSAVLVSHLGERYYQEDFFRFCRHYGTLPDAARPYTPTDKGRTEREIRYIKGSCFAGRDITEFEEAKVHLSRWHSDVAMVRVHGTTRRRPVDLFEEERASLGLLPDTPYEITTFGHYRVRKDCHVQVLGNYYSVPHRFVGKKVTVQIGEGTLRIQADGECVARHARSLGKGESITDPSHYPVEKRISTQEIHRRRLEGVRSAGRWTCEYVARLKEGRWVFGDQVARLSRLLDSYGSVALEQACRRAVFFGALDGAARIERILEKGLEDQPLPSTLIPMPRTDGYGRPLREYDALFAGRMPA